VRGQVRDDGGRQVYRPLAARVMLVLAAVVGLWWDVDLLWRARFGEAVLATGWLVAGCAALGALFWRPAVVVDDEGVLLVNVVRDVRVPFTALERVDTRYALTLLAGGRRYVSWAGAAGGRPPRRRPGAVTGAVLGDLSGDPAGDPPGDPSGAEVSVPASRHVGTASGVTALMVEERWDAWRAAHPAGGAGAGPGAGPEFGARPGADVRWRLGLWALAAGAVALTALLTPVMS